MNTITKKVVSFILVLALCLHFLFVSLFCIGNVKQKANNMAQGYAYPFFTQNWNLFVPVPTTQQSLLVRYKRGNGFIPWKDILQQEIFKHQQNRFMGYETSVLLFSNSLWYFKNIMLAQKTNISQASSPEFVVLGHSVNQYLKLKEKLNSGDGYDLCILISENNKVTHKFFRTLKIY
jgi:hypothetical protein